MLSNINYLSCFAEAVLDSMRIDIVIGVCRTQRLTDYTADLGELIFFTIAIHFRMTRLDYLSIRFNRETFCAKPAKLAILF